MEVYIIAKIVDYANKDLGYVLLDIKDNNKTMSVTKQQLIDAMKAKKIKIENAKLVKDFIAGTYYSLDILPYYRNNMLVVAPYKWLCLKTVHMEVTDDTRYLLCEINDNGVSVFGFDYINMDKYLKYNWIMNVNDAGELLCKNEVNKQNDIKLKQPVKTGNDPYLSKLDEDVTNPETVWSLKDFEYYMQKHNYSYKIDTETSYIGNTINYTLSYIDTQCTKIKIPSEITQVGALYNGMIKNIESLIIGPKVFKIEDIYYGRTDKVKEIYADIEDAKQDKNDNFKPECKNIVVNITNLYFQPNERNRAISMRYTFDFCDIQGVIRIPRNEINYAFNYSKINRIEYNKSTNTENMTKIEKSFNHCIFKFETLDLSNADVSIISESFDTTDNLISIIFGDKQTNVFKSFLNIPMVSVLNFSKAISLCYINNSFFGSNVLTAVDLSNCKSLYSVSYAFKRCKNLSNIKFSDCTKSIYIQGSNQTPLLKTLELPESINSLTIGSPSDIEKVIYPKSVDRLNKGLYVANKTGIQLEFKGKLEKISNKCFSSLSNISIDNTSRTLQFPKDDCIFYDSAFEDSYLEQFDAREFKSLKIIPISCFENCNRLTHVIIDGAVEEIKEYSFRNTPRLEIVILGENIKFIDTKAFSSTKSKLTTFYVIKGSYASKRMNRSKYTVIEVNSVDEAISVVYSKGQTKEEKIPKFEMVLDDTIYSPLLEENYIKNVEYLYKLLVSIERNQELANRLVLNTQKFRALNLETLNIEENSPVSKIIEYVNKLYDINASFQHNNEMTDTFIGLCNFITTLSNRNDALYNEEFRKEFYNILKFKIIYADNKYSIIAYNIQGVSDTNNEILAILFGTTIMYMTAFNTKEVLNQHHDNSYNFLGWNSSNLGNNVSIALELMPGDGMITKLEHTTWEEFALKVHNAEVPEEFRLKVFNLLQNNIKYIGTTTSEAQMNVGTRDKKEINTLYYEPMSQLFLEMTTRHEYVEKIANRKYVPRAITHFLVKNIYKLEDINKINKKYFEDFIDAFNNRRNLKSIELNSIARDKLDKLFEINDTNYNIGENKQVVEFADAMYKYNVNEVKKLTPSITNAMLKLEFFEPSNVSINTCKTKNWESKLIELNNTNDKFIIQFKVTDSVYYIGLIGMDTPMNSKNVLYTSSLSAERIVNLLYSIGIARAKNSETSKKMHIIDDEKVNADEFYFLSSTGSDLLYRVDSYARGYSIDLAVEKQSGYTFLLYEIWDSAFYKIFRFKKYKDAAEEFSKLLTDRATQVNLTHLILYGIHDKRDTRRNNMHKKVRENIMYGMPNNYPYPWDGVELFNALAKQPKT